GGGPTVIGRSDHNHRKVEVDGMRWIAGFTVFALVWSTGCSFLVSSRQPVSVIASNPNAQIYVDGQYAGQGTAVLSLRRNQDHTVMARLGERTGATSIGTSISDVGILDIIGCATFLLPCIGIA